MAGAFVHLIEAVRAFPEELLDTLSQQEVLRLLKLRIVMQK